MKKNYIFFEKELPFASPTTLFGVRVKKKIFEKKTPYQFLEILDTDSFGRMLVLDGIIQTTEKDEFIYHEMISHLPLFYHGNAKKVLIIGGGDGGVLREVLKHPVREVRLIEIDKEVIEASKKYLPFINQDVFKDERVSIFFGDGQTLIKNYKNFFDVIIIDSSDPIGPAKPLFTYLFYSRIFSALRKDGIMIAQSGNLFEEEELVLRIVKKNIEKIFPFVRIHWAVIPSYQSGAFTFTVGSKTFNLNKITLKTLKRRFKKVGLTHNKYYSPEIHLASGVLPKIYKI